MCIKQLFNFSRLTPPLGAGYIQGVEKKVTGFKRA